PVLSPYFPPAPLLLDAPTFFLSTTRRPPRSTLFPYTTLFRSAQGQRSQPPWSPTQTSPSSKYSFFHTGTVFLSVSIAYRHASKASPRCSAETAMSTLDSPISSRPVRWSIAMRRTPAQRERTGWPIPRIVTSATGSCASYPRYLTGRPPVWFLTTPEKITMPPAPGSSTSAAIASGERGSVTTRKMSAAAPPLTGGKRQ